MHPSTNEDHNVCTWCGFKMRDPRHWRAANSRVPPSTLWGTPTCQGGFHVGTQRPVHSTHSQVQAGRVRRPR